MMKIAAGMQFKKVKNRLDSELALEQDNYQKRYDPGSEDDKAESASDFSLNETNSRIEEENQDRRNVNRQSRPELKEHYLRAADFLEIQIYNAERDLCSHSEPVKLIVGLIDLINVDKVVPICFDWEKQEILFAAIQLLSWRIE